MKSSIVILIFLCSGGLNLSKAHEIDQDMADNIAEGQRVVAEIDGFLLNRAIPDSEKVTVQSEVNETISAYQRTCTARSKRSIPGISCNRSCCRIIPRTTSQRTYAQSYRTTTSYITYYGYSCGLFGWSRCTRSRTAYRSRTNYRQSTRYFTISTPCPDEHKTCCNGYFYYKNCCISIARLRQILDIIIRLRGSDPCSSSDTVSLTGSWRKDRVGSNIRPYFGLYVCDRELQRNSSWFRFSGTAGTQLLNTCPADYSCGSHGGFWSDAAMPSGVGEVRQVPIYGSWDGNCRWYRWPTTNSLTVKRCSSGSGDFVYKAHGTGSCAWAFCGMD